jgi:hypothetical protein
MRTRVFSDRLVLGGRDVKQLCYRILSWDMCFMFHSEVRGEEYHESRDLINSDGGSSLCVDEKFAW